MDISMHIEKYLGHIKQGWAWPERPGLSVALFEDQPAKGEQTLATLGLSENILRLPNERAVRLEFLLVASKFYEPSPLAGSLLRFALSFLGSGRAPLRGDVFGPGPELAPGSGKAYVYCTTPSIFPEALVRLHGTNPDTIFVWIVPVSEREADFVRSVGWSAFEDRLEMENPSLADLNRRDICLRNN